MKIEKNFDQKGWDIFVSQQELAQFLQSWSWGDFQQNLGRRYWRFPPRADQHQAEKSNWGQALVIKHNLPFNKNYLYCPRGPILTHTQTNADYTQTDTDKTRTDADHTRTNTDRTRTDAEKKLEENKNFKSFFREIIEIANQEKSIFFRFELPILLNFWSDNEQKFGTKWSIRRSFSEGGLPIVKIADVQPSQTPVLNLSKSEEEILTEMHYKTRYNIRLAERRGIKIRQGQPAEIEKFLNLLKQTAKRDKFRPHPDNYYCQLIKIDIAKLYLAEYQNKVLAANIIIFFGDTVTYLHGASDNKYKSLMAPHLLQWAAIKEAKRLGYLYYDFWGINEKKWPGVTRFKRGFGGKEINYPGTFDVIFDNFWYRLYRLGKKFLV